MTTLQHAAFVADAREAHALYLTMRTEELLELRAAFILDTAAATQPESIAFGAGRLALIASVLKARATVPRATSSEVADLAEGSQT